MPGQRPLLHAAAGDAFYGEEVTQLEHAIQCAGLARQGGARNELVLAAFLQALDEHEYEGGVKARLARYTSNRECLVNGMRRRGFATLLEDR